MNDYAAVTEENLRAIVVDMLDVDPKEVTLEARLVADLGADSLALVEIVLACEEKFGVDIPDEEVEKVETVGQALDVCRRLAKVAA